MALGDELLCSGNRRFSWAWGHFSHWLRGTILRRLHTGSGSGEALGGRQGLRPLLPRHREDILKDLAGWQAEALSSDLGYGFSGAGPVLSVEASGQAGPCHRGCIPFSTSHHISPEAGPWMALRKHLGPNAASSRRAKGSA